MVSEVYDGYFQCLLHRMTRRRDERGGVPPTARGKATIHLGEALAIAATVG